MIPAAAPVAYDAVVADHLAIVVLAVGGLVAFLVYKVTLVVREAREEKQQALRALGFEPLDPPPADVVEPLLALHRRGKPGGKKIENLYERTGSGDRLYLFDLKDAPGDAVHNGVIGVVSPRLRVPRLTIFPWLEGGGRLSALGNLLLKRLGGRHGEIVDLGAHPRFSSRHFVSAPDAEAARRFLTEERLDRLAEMGHMAVEAEGDRFTYQEVHFKRRRRPVDDAGTLERVQQAEELLRTLGD
jgi:hypothetical protein